MIRHSESFEADPAPTLRRYLGDPAFRAQVDADADRRQREINRRMDAAIERANPRKWDKSGCQYCDGYFHGGCREGGY